MKQTSPGGSSPAAAADASPTPTTEPSSAPPLPFACANLTCTTFPTASDALAAALSEPVGIVGFGEAHAPSDFTARTTVRRFQEELLPALAPRAGRLLVELLVPPKGCEEQRQQVQTESDAITSGQSKDNQNEYVELGRAARELGVVPDILRPSCRDMQAIADAEVGVLVMMETIATLSVEATREWLAVTNPERRLVILYGGALHNDLSPRDNLETWSYGPRLSELSAGHYVEVDLVVPELVQDTDSWRKFVWYDAVRALAKGHGPTLVQASERSFALVFEATPE